MQVNKYTVEVRLDGKLTLHVNATTSEEAESLAHGHITKIAERQWEAPHAAPGITRIDEDLRALVIKADLVASDNP